ncbi:PspC domain-containing protein [Patulibacter brassicae]|uniref:PspC domain-containing protein n=1 Tax=Patulibacter brassicae TaxID=1705717 RepID=A0ABU4VN14_9ACTN|nr:PspC domain-containing protein [Patulibacter brassicae]MDX8152747.1 PspC domain-containing protein [Patulibacter brassicae]
MPDPTPDPSPDEPTVARPSPDDAPTGAGADPAGGAERGLLRSSTDRVLFGVCGGIGERYGVEPILIRIAFVIAVFFGGSGLLFYLAAAILVPSAAAPAAGAPGAAAAGTAASGAARLLVGMAAILASLVGLAAVAALGFGLTAFFGGWPVAVLLVLLGVVLIVSARSRPASAALLLVIVSLAIPASAAVIGDVRVDDTVGERTFAPVSAPIAREGSRLGIGELTVDLRDLDAPRRGRPLRIPARVDVGHLLVRLPSDRCITWRIRSDLRVAGELVSSGDSFGPARTFLSGTGERELEIDPGGRRRPVVELDLRVGVGQIDIVHGSDGDQQGAVRSGWRSGDRGATLRTAACEERR